MIEKMALQDLVLDPKNARKHSKKNLEAIKGSLKKFGQQKPIVITDEGIVIAGNGTVEAAKSLGWADIQVVRSKLTGSDITAYAIADNRTGELAEWDLSILPGTLEALSKEFDLGEIGFDADDLTNFLGHHHDDTNSDDGKGSLKEKFLMPPFTVLDTKQSYWQDRKRNWLSLGINSEEGREENLIPTKHIAEQYGRKPMGTSIFDPVMCELAYLWFSKKEAYILDPFAGGSVRGIVAAKLERNYVGIDLRKEQIEANEKQAHAIAQNWTFRPAWHVGDSRDITKIASGKYDFLFSCPPYGDLESYSDNKNDLSNLNYDDFKKSYYDIILKSCSLLKEDRFACFVVGDFRDKKGMYRNFVSHTIEAFLLAGLHLYNEAILVTAIGSLPVRVKRYFEGGRKLGKTHQNVLVFVKGDPKKATQACGEVEISFGSESDKIE